MVLAVNLSRSRVRAQSFHRSVAWFRPPSLHPELRYQLKAFVTTVVLVDESPHAVPWQINTTVLGSALQLAIGPQVAQAWGEPLSEYRW